MKIFILASGNAERWNGKIKQLVPIRGEPLLLRTMGMLEGYDYKILTHREEIQVICKERYLVPEHREKLLSTVLSSVPSWEGEDEVCFLLGDVIFTRKALTQILAPIDKSFQFYGSLDENFAFRFNIHWYDRVKEYCQKIISSSRLGTSWELYRSMAEIPLDKEWTDCWFRTLILDRTDDIDYPTDYESKMASNYFEDKELDI